MTWGSALSALLLLTMIVASALGRPRLARLRKTLVRHLDRIRRALPSTPRAPGRPIEEIARDAHRIGTRFHGLPARNSFAQLEGRRMAYDGVLVEACAALGVDHLLEVLPPGPELDGERHRVESVLGAAGLGLGLGDAA
ncbi:hypothetical protein BH10ACT10_BH10ACT10_21900 [soil metagenome]